MRIWIFLLLVFVFCIFQVTLSSTIALFGVSPDCFLLCVLLASLHFEWNTALLLSAFCGLLKDIFGIYPVGLYTLLFPLASLLILKVSRKMTLEVTYLSAIAMFLVVLGNNLAVRMILYVSGNAIPWYIYLRRGLLESLYTALLVPWICSLVAPLLSGVYLKEKIIKEEEL